MANEFPFSGGRVRRIVLHAYQQYEHLGLHTRATVMRVLRNCSFCLTSFTHEPNKAKHKNCV